MDGQSLLVLLGFLAACFVAAASGSVFRPGEWYERLVKPSWRPPNWLFAPVWAVLYVMIAVSGWLVWREVGWAAAAVPLLIYAAQLVLNGFWSFLFFRVRRMDLALFDLVLLWVTIAATIAAFYPLHAGAAWLLVPYLVWVSFASVLNLSMWRLNRGPTSTPDLA